MGDWSGSEEISWSSDDDSAAVETDAVVAGDCRASGVSESEAGPSNASRVAEFVSMGFDEEMVLKAITENGEGNSDLILNTLLTNNTIEDPPSPLDDSSASDSNISDMEDVEDVDFTEDYSEKDRKLVTLVDMGYAIAEANAAIERCGEESTLLELADSIEAARLAEDPAGFASLSPASSSAETEGPIKSCITESHIGQKRVRAEEKRKYSRIRYQERKGKRVSLEEDASVMCQIPKPMIGFGLPNEQMRITNRHIPEFGQGPPFFYYENVALAPKGVWEDMSRNLNGIEPEFVDSKFFSAAARKRGYIHNLPIVGRFPLLPIPPKTIHEALPMTRKWWPAWDERRQLNCLQTCIASAKLTERIRSSLAECDNPPPLGVRKFVLEHCKTWNLVWVGLHKVAPLEPDEIEMLLGFPKNHTRGGGISRTDRYKSLGNSFQVDTVAFHLSVLKGMYPNGLNVLSLFSGIGGAEVALHRLGIKMKLVVSVEISEINRNIVRGWWEQTDQGGTLVHIANVKDVKEALLEQMIDKYGGFDLIVGGSPCNNLAGSNRHTRDGLQGTHSSLFYDYIRILDSVKCLMAKKL